MCRNRRLVLLGVPVAAAERCQQSAEKRIRSSPSDVFRAGGAQNRVLQRVECRGAACAGFPWRGRCDGGESVVVEGKSSNERTTGAAARAERERCGVSITPRSLQLCAFPRLRPPFRPVPRQSGSRATWEIVRRHPRALHAAFRPAAGTADSTGPGLTHQASKFKISLDPGSFAAGSVSSHQVRDVHICASL